MLNNYYEILNISKDASLNDIKRAYYSLCKKYHPDINPKTANLFKNITEAYNTLSDPIKRREYDNNINTIKNEDEFDYYQNAQYYQNPKNEPLFSILYNLKQYRLENALSAIYSRNIFILFGNAFLCIYVLSYKLLHKINKKQNKIPLSKKPAKSIVLWFTILFTIATLKTIITLLKAIYWIFKNIIRYFILPVTIFLVAFMFNKGYPTYRQK